MKVKINTKEKFHVISIEEPVISANMTEEITEQLLPYLKNDIKNIVLKMQEIVQMDKDASQTLVNIQQQFYENEASFVICELTPDVEKYLDELELLELMNTTKTESEAWDIVQMEEIERELL